MTINTTQTAGLVALSIEATVLATWVAYTSDVSFAVALVFFMLFRPGASLAADAVANHYNPADRSREWQWPPLGVIAAVQGILMEWEDNQPGGWLNPKDEK